jgi:hypothetical protein
VASSGGHEGGRLAPAGGVAGGARRLWLLMAGCPQDLGFERAQPDYLTVRARGRGAEPPDRGDQAAALPTGPGDAEPLGAKAAAACRAIPRGGRYQGMPESLLM